jgi:hypothetical protein
MRTERTNVESRCPACQRTLDAATDILGQATPEPGDLSVCVYCSVVLTFNTDLTLRSLRQAEFDALSEELRAQLRVYRILVEPVEG